MGRTQESAGRRILRKERTRTVGEDESQAGGRGQRGREKRFLEEMSKMRRAAQGAQLSKGCHRSMHRLQRYLARCRRAGTGGREGRGWLGGSLFPKARLCVSGSC